MLHLRHGKKYTSGPRYWNVPVLVNTGTFLVYQYWLKMWSLCSLERTGVIQKLTILECKNGLVLSNTRVLVSGTWSLLFPRHVGELCWQESTHAFAWTTFAHFIGLSQRVLVYRNCCSAIYCDCEWARKSFSHFVIFPLNLSWVNKPYQFVQLLCYT